MGSLETGKIQWMVKDSDDPIIERMKKLVEGLNNVHIKLAQAAKNLHFRPHIYFVEAVPSFKCASLTVA